MINPREINIIILLYYNIYKVDRIFNSHRIVYLLTKYKIMNCKWFICGNVQDMIDFDLELVLIQKK